MEQQATVLPKAPKLGALALCLLALSVPLPLFAAAAHLTGRVTDPAGSAVPGARLTLTSSSGLACRHANADENGEFTYENVLPGRYWLTAEADGLVTTSKSVSVTPGQISTANIQFLKLASEVETITVAAAAPATLTPDPGKQFYVYDELLEANPGLPGAPVSIPGLPIETASGGIKAPQYFAPGVAGDHGEAIAQFFQIGDFLLPNNLPANAHGNGYADPNFLIAQGIGMVEVDGGAFDVREGNHAVDLAAAYGPWPHLEPFFQFSGDGRNFDMVTGWGPRNPRTRAWIALETSFGNGHLKLPENREQYKLNAYRAFAFGDHQVTVFGIGYYGFSRLPGMIPIAVNVPDDTVDPRQQDRTHTSIGVVTDTWNLASNQKFMFSGFFRTYSLDLRSNFGEGLIKQSEFRTVAGGNASYVYKIEPQVTLIAGMDFRRDAPRGLDLHRADQNGIFQPLTSNDLTLRFVTPFVSIDGPLSRYFHYNLGVRREQVSMDNVDKIDFANSFNRSQGITLPKGTITVLPPGAKFLPTVAFSFGEAFHTNDPRIGAGARRGTVLVPSRAYQVVVKKQVQRTDFQVRFARVANSKELAKVDPDNGLQFDLGPSIIRSVTISARRYFSFGSLQASWARADAHDRLTRQPILEAPRLIWDVVGTADRLPLHVRARGEFEYVGRKPLGDGFTSVPVRELRAALLRAFGNGRIDLGLNFLGAAGSTGQTTEVLALSSEPTPFERIVGVPLKSYVSASFTYNFGRRESGERR